MWDWCLTIKEIEDSKLDEYIEQVKSKLDFYKPDTVRRTFIPKDNGKERPLGVPTMIDRLVE